MLRQRIALLAALWVAAACEDGARPTPKPTPGAAAARPAATQTPFDLSAVVQKVRFAFRPEGGKWTSGYGSFAARASAGELVVTPVQQGPASGKGRHHPRRQQVEGAAAVFTTLAIERGGVALEPVGEPSLESDGSLAFPSPSHLARVRSGPEGVEQTWTFPRAPAGTGELTVRMRVSGQRYRGATGSGLHFADPVTGLGVRYGVATWVDASGERTPVPARVEGDELVLAVSADTLARSAFPAVLDPFITPELGMDNPITGAANADQGQAAGAFDGTNWLVVWSDLRRGLVYDVYGARVQPDGTVLDPAGFSINSSAGHQWAPRVAFGGGNYLVVFGDDRNAATLNDIYAARVSPAGVVLDPNGFSVCPQAADQDAPDLAFDGNNFLVVWEDYRSGTFTPDIYGSRVTPAGAVLNPSGMVVSSAADAQYNPSVAFGAGSYLVVWEDYRAGVSLGDIWGARVSTAGALQDASGVQICGASGTQQEPSVAFGSANFLVAWHDFRGGTTSDLYARLFDPAGGPQGAATGLMISNAAEDQLSASVAFDGTNYLVAWEDVRSGTNSNLYARRLSTAGATVGAEITISTATQDQQLPKVIAGSGQWLLVWNDKRADSSTQSDVYAARVSAAGVLEDSGGVLVSKAVNRQTTPAAAYDGTNYLVVWEDGRTKSGTGIDLYGTRVSATGTLLDLSGIAVSIAVGDQRSPALAFNGTDYLVVWQDGRNPTVDVYGTRVSKAGGVQDPTGIVISNGTYDQLVPSVASDGTNWLAVWQDCRFDASCSADPDIMSARIDPLGVVLDPAGRPVSSGLSAETSPAVGFDGNEYLAVWTDARNLGTTDLDVYASRIGADGTALDSSGFVVSDFAKAQWNPALTFGGGTFLVVWADCRDDADDCPLNSNIYGTRISPGGLVQNATGMVVSNATGHQLRPRVAYSGMSFVAAWEDERNAATGEKDVYGARVTFAGALLDAAGFAISNGSGLEQRPALASDGNGATLVAYEQFDGTAAVRSIRVRGRLVQDLPLGRPCTSAEQCNSGFCASGVCCVSACNGGPCQACSIDAGVGVDGTCSFLTSTAVCRAAAGACDVAESCSGSSAACPVDVLRAADQVCRATGGPCDVEETCSGNDAGCPGDSLKASGQVCRAAAGLCDVAETCSGNDAGCPGDLLKASGQVCRAAAGLCDVAETCSGNDAGCAGDSFKAAGQVCRAAAGPCDVGESCSGVDAGCPADALKAAGQVCRAAAGPCDVGESCSGVDAGCPADALKAAGQVCRAAAGLCDVGESCSGNDAGCPTDSLKPAGQVCRAAAGLCDVGESCSGNDAGCPSDLLAPAGQICRVAAGLCDVQESCSGGTTGCPGDQLAADGTSCGNEAVCRAGVCLPDAGSDGGADAGPDGGEDAGRDGGPDAGLDGGKDGGDDGGSDGGADGGFDAGIDGGLDAGFDAGPDLPDAGADAGVADAGVSTESDGGWSGADAGSRLAPYAGWSCGCASSGGLGPGALAFLLLALRGRRRSGAPR